MGSRAIRETSLTEMAGMMIGRGDEGLNRVAHATQPLSGKIALKVRDLVVDMPGERARA